MEKRVPGAVPSLNEIKKLIKQENINCARLTSLRLPKDLNLGGTKPKKVYTPNLNVVRNKDKHNQVSTKGSRNQPTLKRSLSNVAHHDKNKRLKFIESDGIFSQGIGERKATLNNVERAPSLRESTALVMPKINKNNVLKNKNSTEISMITNHEDDSDSDSNNEYEPIVLPLDSSFANAFAIKEEPIRKIKTEDTNGDINLNVSNSVDDKIKVEKFASTSFLDDTKEYDDDNPAISLIRLPSSFFGKVWSEDSKETNLDYSLKCLPEGHLGKICIRKSGKMEFVTKNFKFDLNTEDPNGFSEMAVQFPGKESIALEPSLVTLGSVAEKLVATPEWNRLFESAKQNNKFYW